MPMDADGWIESLNLEPHPEGGYFRETYRSNERVAREHLPARFTGDRTFSTAIYFLLQSPDFSAFHRIKQDELWHYYDGGSATIHVIDPAGNYFTHRIGRNPHKDQRPQAPVAAGSWFGATVDDPSSFVLAGCTVAPGFEFDDFEMPTRQALLKLFPHHREIIERLTRA